MSAFDLNVTVFVLSEELSDDFVVVRKFPDDFEAPHERRINEVCGCQVFFFRVEPRQPQPLTHNINEGTADDCRIRIVEKASQIGLFGPAAERVGSDVVQGLRGLRAFELCV